MAFELPNLPYAHDALSEFGMSKETLEYHHDLHHEHVDNGKLIDGTEWSDKSLEEIIVGTEDCYQLRRMVFLTMRLHWNRY